jgi:hypothetical protein
VNRCTRCDNENSPGHRFCGMCGDPLPTVEERVRPSSSLIATPPATVAGPSFLGLAEPASGGYLLEDEPRRGKGLLYLAFAVLLATGAIFAWRWRAEGYAGRALMASRKLLEDPDHRTRTDPDRLRRVNREQIQALSSPANQMTKVNSCPRIIPQTLELPLPPNLRPPKNRR